MASHFSPSAPEPRQYQKEIAQEVLQKGSSLVVLPTGLGKTLIALMVADKMLEKGKVLILAPTKPLVSQHEKTCREMLNLKEDEIAMVSGQITAKKRPDIYKSNAKILLSTPQTIANDLEHKRMEWNFVLVVVDEAHRSVGKYAYTKVAQVAKENNALILGLTASPGGQKKKIEEILEALGIKNVQIRASEDEDVVQYVKPLEVRWIEVRLSEEMGQMKKMLEEMMGERAHTLKKMGFIGRFGTKKGLVELRVRILASRSGLRFSALSHHSTLFSLLHILELLETQGVEATRRFVQRVREREESKAQKRLLSDARFVIFEERLKNAGEHPKLEKLIGIVQARPVGEKFIVFSQYRDQVNVLVNELKKFGLKAEAFMGKKDGITQKGQAQTILDFREGKFDILVATSIGEEGLDIPSVDNVIFYEPVPSEIRSIQRRGRAGRAKMGRMFGLVTLGTRDQAFFWSARKKEEKMKRIVRGMSEKGKREDAVAREKTDRKEKDAAKEKIAKAENQKEGTGAKMPSALKAKGKMNKVQSTLKEFGF